MGDSQKDVTSVEAAANEYLKDKINATIKLNAISGAQYGQKLPTMMAANEYYDIAFCSTWMLNYPSTASTNAWIALDGYWDKYLPKTKAILGENAIESAKVNGKVYAIPTNKEMFVQRGFTYREDLAEKYNIDFSKIKSFADLEPALKIIKENEPGLQYPIDWGADRTPFDLNIYQNSPFPLVIYADKYDGRVVNAYETEELKEAALTARHLFEAGYVKRDVLTSKDFDQRLKAGKIFAYVDFLKPGKAKEASKDFTFPLNQTELTSAVYEPSTGSMNAISRTSKNPERAMRFMELYNNDEYLNNLLVYGIEGKHYTKLDADTVEITPNSGYTMSGTQWMLGNVFINYLTRIEPKDKYTAMKKLNDEAVMPQYFGFVFDPTPVSQEAAAIGVVSNDFKSQITSGAMDPLPLIEQVNAKLKASGIDKVKAEAQKQFDAFLAAKKR
jgi:putative aldouronate transport system substrate-binding protein